jgi:outer membrane lipoprotein SlyB
MIARKISRNGTSRIGVTAAPLRNSRMVSTPWTRATSVPVGRSLQARSGYQSSARQAARVCVNCGVVEAINLVEVKGTGSYLGMIAGGVAGALLGSQVGQGRGTTAAQVAGAAGGAFAVGAKVKVENATLAVVQ